MASDSEDVPKYSERDMQNALSLRKRKIEEIIECIICKVIPSEGRIRQCHNGHLACERCMSNERLTTCGLCREPLDNKKICALVVEQLIEAIDLEVSCKHPNCMFRATKTVVKTHERSCDRRIVECPDTICPENLPLHALLDHMKCGNPALYPVPTVGTVTHRGEIIPEIFKSDMDLGWHCKVNEFQGEIFASTLQRTNGIWYAYTYIIGNSEKAEKFKVKICVGKQNVAAIFCQGNVFPIDAKRTDIMKANHSVLSFTQRGMAEQLCHDCVIWKRIPLNPSTTKRIQISYEIICNNNI